MRKKASKKVLFQCIGANLAYSAAIFLLIGLAIAFCNQVIWYWEDPLYRLLNFVQENMPFFVIPVMLCGWLPITYHFLSKILRKLDEVAQAAEQLATPGEEPISLSEDLVYVEKDLNRAREKALQDDRVAKEAEQRKNDLVVYLAHDLKTPLTSVLGYLTLLHDEPQRKFLSLGDMIVSGHKNGPLAPTPIKLGVLVCSEDPVAFDLSVINLMGLDYNMLPTLNKIKNTIKYPIYKEKFESINILSNDPRLNGTNISTMPVASYGQFEPAEGWDVIRFSRK